MRVITANVNGIRSANNKGFFKWLATMDADIICLQEIKVAMEDIPEELMNWNGYHSSFHPAEKKGYSGVAASPLGEVDYNEFGWVLQGNANLNIYISIFNRRLGVICGVTDDVKGRSWICTLKVSLCPEVRQSA